MELDDGRVINHCSRWNLECGGRPHGWTGFCLLLFAGQTYSYQSSVRIAVEVRCCHKALVLTESDYCLRWPCLVIFGLPRLIDQPSLASANKHQQTEMLVRNSTRTQQLSADKSATAMNCKQQQQQRSVALDVMAAWLGCGGFKLSWDAIVRWLNRFATAIPLTMDGVPRVVHQMQLVWPMMFWISNSVDAENRQISWFFGKTMFFFVG
ncbi:hypothetical protein Nepgr_002621 [Nepenthes gracilis]|uniref:Uncharacterized protein n=1 Tax=Nepenthes gracilis TaxID=150966 RepID=A0AAD3RX20_NEPGR|nr:hypothetical protein Nepgr_002621 [Nepenthes gracilis]